MLYLLIILSFFLKIATDNIKRAILLVGFFYNLIFHFSDSLILFIIRVSLLSVAFIFIDFSYFFSLKFIIFYFIDSNYFI